jgi:hypothetical protein
MPELKHHITAQVLSVIPDAILTIEVRGEYDEKLGDLTIRNGSIRWHRAGSGYERGMRWKRFDEVMQVGRRRRWNH